MKVTRDVIVRPRILCRKRAFPMSNTHREDLDVQRRFNHDIDPRIESVERLDKGVFSHCLRG